jgi:TetR/AcrR family transcriptional repressor of nem operon
MAEHIEGLVDKLTETLGDRDKATAAVSTMVGALALSRVMTDPKRSDAILKAAKDQVLAMDPSEPD